MAKGAVGVAGLTGLGYVIVVEASVAEALGGCGVEGTLEGGRAHDAVVAVAPRAHLAAVVAGQTVSRGRRRVVPQ